MGTNKEETKYTSTSIVLGCMLIALKDHSSENYVSDMQELTL